MKYSFNKGQKVYITDNKSLAVQNYGGFKKNKLLSETKIPYGQIGYIEAGKNFFYIHLIGDTFSYSHKRNNNNLKFDYAKDDFEKISIYAEDISDPMLIRFKRKERETAQSLYKDILSYLDV